MTKIILDSLILREWLKFHKFLKNLENSIKKPITEKEFTALGSILYIIKDEAIITEIKQESNNKIICSSSIVKRSRDSKDVSQERLNYSKEIYNRLKKKYLSIEKIK